MNEPHRMSMTSLFESIVSHACWNMEGIAGSDCARYWNSSMAMTVFPYLVAASRADSQSGNLAPGIPRSPDTEEENLSKFKTTDSSVAKKYIASVLSLRKLSIKVVLPTLRRP